MKKQKVKTKDCLIIAGELSGEEHALSFLPELINRNTDFKFWGVGGEAMRALGVDLQFNLREFSSMGFTEVLRKLKFYKEARRKILNLARERETSIAILIDFQ